MTRGRSEEARANRRRVHRPTSWVEVWRGDGEAQAEIVAQGRGASGVRTRVLSSALTLPYGAQLQISAWTILVPGHEADRARELLHERHEGARVVSGEAGAVADNFRLVLRLTALAGALFAMVVLLMALRAAL
ncbi:MAG: hypothetical protein IT304_06285 [Dehalococcoidia bacterium]|nr:hypothetical protein [Dehalococcoidia bacterium]